MALKRFYQGKETADSFIERYVYELYDKHTKHITVVTSDMSEQHAIFGSVHIEYHLAKCGEI